MNDGHVGWPDVSHIDIVESGIDMRCITYGPTVFMHASHLINSFKTLRILEQVTQGLPIDTILLEFVSYIQINRSLRLSTTFNLP